MATTTELLADAEAKYHALLTGRAVVELRDQNGEVVRYNQASAPKLKAYIDELKLVVAGTPTCTGPMRVFL